MLKNIIVLNKKEGETPLEALSSFRAKNDEYKDESITYAGRLDPMAEGVLILLVGEKIKEKEKYLALGKEYEFKVLFGFATDTYDILGKLTPPRIFSHYVRPSRIPRLKKSEEAQLVLSIEKNLKYFTGKFIQKYPPYSSRTVKGKPLFEYSRNNIDVEIPEKEVNVKELKLLKINKIKREKLLENIERRIKKVKGDFRQEEIIKIWRHILKQELSLLKSLLKSAPNFFVASFKIKCGSGTYVRGIANALGEKMNIPALAFHIKRTKVGKYKIKK